MESLEHAFMHISQEIRAKTPYPRVSGYFCIVN